MASDEATTNVRILRTMYRYLRHEVGAAEAERFLASLGLDERFLQNEDNWVAFDLYARACEEIVRLTGDPMVGLEVGRFSISKHNLGSLWAIARATAYLGGGTAAGYRIVPRLANRVTRVGRLEVASLTPTTARFRWTQRAGVPFFPLQCQYRRGLLAAGPRMGDLPPALVEEVACLGRGDDACVYDLRFGADRVVSGLRWGALAGVAGWVAAGIGGLGWGAGGLLALAAAAVGFARDQQSQLAWNTRLLSDQLDELTSTKARLEEEYDLLRRTQQELRDKERLASLGELSARVAHELRNPLGVIKASAQVLGDEAKPPEVRREVTAFILEEADRMNASITNFLVFARPKVSHRTPTNLAAAVERLLLEWETRAAKGVRTSLAAPAGLPRVLVDPHQLHQVLLNLLLNAAEAMGSSGTIRLAAVPAGERVRITVEDDGTGFTSEALARAAEPFFTTKEYGTGLGLTNVRQMVEANGGTLALENAPAGGARITITLDVAR
jgi:signal transduction histidine kinase